MKLLLQTLTIIGIVAVAMSATIYSTTSCRNGIRFIDDISDKQETSDEVLISSDSMSLRYSNEYRSWKNTIDTTFRSLYNGNQRTDVLAARPRMVVLWAGYAFAKDYETPRGHMYAIEDVRGSLRTGSPMHKTDYSQPAACWACKSSDIPRLTARAEGKTLYKKKWVELGSEAVNPIGCADCHEPESMTLRVTRSFLVDAYSCCGRRMEDATEQEMRSLVCAQCHSEYYLRGEDRMPALPWNRGYALEDMEAYYDSLHFTDFIHKLSSAPLLKAQHPDFELAQMGIHAQRGVSCGECHMPAVGEGEKRYNNHHIKSPLAMIDRTCQTCHRESEETLRNDVYERQGKVLNMRNRLEEELTKAHIEARFAWDKGATDKQMEPVLQLIRQSQWRWDFSVTSWGASFHAPQEVLRLLGDGFDKASQARMSLMKLLSRLGYVGEVPMPDLSTKGKAQLYIGLDMEKERIDKQKFLETVVPQWLEEAKANKRIIE